MRAIDRPFDDGKPSMPTSVRYPDGNVLLRSLSKDLPVVARGEGVYLFDKTGKRYVDGSSGALVVSVGHGNREVAARIAEQISNVGYVNGTQFTSEATESLATKLVAIAREELPSANLTRAAFLCSGSEAIEAAVKFVRQLWMERGEPARTKMIARVPSYHGNTLYALSMSGRPHYKKLYGPMLSEVLTTQSPYGYRYDGPGTYEEHGADHFARLFEEALIAADPKTVAAFIAEPVIGSSAGAALPPPRYFAKLRAVCERYGVLMIADEVLCGSGRTGDFFASKTTDFRPDVVVLGKGIGGGLAPLSVVLVREDHVEEMRKGSGYFQHAQTYLQAPFITAAGEAVLDYFEQHRLLDHVRHVGPTLQAKLRERLASVSYVGNVSGTGLLAGVEFVEDRVTKAPFARSRKVIERLTQHLFERGLIVWPNVGQANGTDGDLLMIGPPLVITETQIDELVDTLARSLEEFVP